MNSFLICVLCYVIPQAIGQFAYDDYMADEVLACLKKGLGAKTFRRIRGGQGGGCINTGQGFIIDNKKWVQVKCNYRDKIARPMFEAEMHCLNLLGSLNLPHVKIAKTYKIIDLPYMKGGACLVIEYLDTAAMSNNDHHANVGKALAYLHLHNKRMKTEQPDKYVSKFGFHMPTYCGRIPQDNTWKDDWVDFIVNNRIQNQIKLLAKQDHNEEAYNLWEFNLKQHVHKLFENITVEPALLHGDLWHSNVGQSSDEKECHIYDPACFYGHNEYDLAITRMFGGFQDEFYEAYHSIIPKQEPNYDNRQNLYLLFHFLNHWNHFGKSYMSGTIRTMKKLQKAINP